MMTRIHILTGPVNSGKTTFLRDVLTGFAPPRPLRGYLSLRVIEEGRSEGYDLLDLSDGSERPFLRREGDPGWQRVGPYFLIPETLALAERIIRESAPGGLLVVDEVGPLEMSGGGIWQALDGILHEGDRDAVLVVREGLLEICQGRLDGLPTTVYRGKDKPELRRVLGRDDIAVKVKFFATYKKLFGPGEREALLPPGSTALDLLRPEHQPG